VLPFGNSLVVVELSGRMLVNAFDRKAGRRSSGLTQSGAIVVADPDAPRGERILEMTIQGKPVELDRMYKVVTSDYLMEGNSGFDFLAQLPPDASTYTMQLTRAAVTRYLEKHSPISPKRDNRWSDRPDGERAAYLKAMDLP
jgi:5'-nucleotidase/UDP-sugar diphosphatase